MQGLLRLMLIGLVIISPVLALDAAPDRIFASESTLSMLADGGAVQRPGSSIPGASEINWDVLISRTSGSSGAAENTNLAYEIGTKLNYLYLSELDRTSPKGNDLDRRSDGDAYIKSPNSGTADSNPSNDDIVSLSRVASGIATSLNYIYEKKTDSTRGALIEKSDAIMGEHMNYLYKDVSSHTSLNYILNSNSVASSEPRVGLNSAEQKDHTRDPYVSSASNLDYIFKQAKASDGKDRGSFPTIISNLNRLIQEGRQVYALPNLILESSFDYSKLINFNQLNIVRDTPAGKNYAVVVGINKYSDRMGLHTCVNDADAVAGILKSYGYEVIKLTDETEAKPSKHNILKGALAEIDLTADRGKVILYFSGHGEVDQAGNFYLVPQDANGAPSSYISEEDINQYTRDVKNLAIIIDACKSGAFGREKEDGRLVIASSKENEPSNEAWMGPLSVFTYNLCSALQNEARSGGRILLQSCFERARQGTVEWSSSRLLSQTPSIIDGTNGRFYLS